MSIEHHISKDGSSTLYSKEYDQYYHNPNGAISESRHVFFEQSGLINFLKDSVEPVSIFETGFGTGLNYLLLLEYVKLFRIQIPIHFYSVEAYPADIESIKQINYPDKLEGKGMKPHLLSIFEHLKSGWNQFNNSNIPNVKLSLFVGFFDDLTPPVTPINYFLHDPFSPEVNAELWKPSTFERLNNFAKSGAILSTYCAATKARAAMAKAGWFVARAPGALGKREMTVASLNQTKLSHLKRVNELRLIERFENGDFDQQ